MVLILKLRGRVVKQQTKVGKIKRGRALLWINASFNFKVDPLHCKIDLWAFLSLCILWSAVLNQLHPAPCALPRRKGMIQLWESWVCNHPPYPKPAFKFLFTTLFLTPEKQMVLWRGKPPLFARSLCWFITTGVKCFPSIFTLSCIAGRLWLNSHYVTTFVVHRYSHTRFCWEQPN